MLKPARMMRIVALCTALSACASAPAWHHPRAAIAGGLGMAVLGGVALNMQHNTSCDGSPCYGTTYNDSLGNLGAQLFGPMLLVGGLAAVGVGLVALSREQEAKTAPHKM